MELFSKTEELIMLTVWHLGEEAYGVTIREHMMHMTSKKFSIGGIYVPLDRLVRKGFLTTFQGEPTPERGGMSKRFYRITPRGVRALSEAKRVHDLLWDNAPTISFATG